MGLSTSLPRWLVKFGYLVSVQAKMAERIADELQKQAVPRCLNDTAVMRSDCGVDDLPAMRFQRFERADLVRAIKRE